MHHEARPRPTKCEVAQTAQDTIKHDKAKLKQNKTLEDTENNNEKQQDSTRWQEGTYNKRKEQLSLVHAIINQTADFIRGSYSPLD